MGYYRVWVLAELPPGPFLGHITLYYVLNDYILSKYGNYEVK